MIFPVFSLIKLPENSKCDWHKLFLAERDKGMSLLDLNMDLKGDLKILRSAPEGFLDIAPRQITDIISRPSILHLKGGGSGPAAERPLFVSILLHGNEVSGLKIVQRVLKKLGNQPLPSDLIIFAGNPQACARGERFAAGQPDFNRIWGAGDSKEHGMARAVLRYARGQNIRAAIDIHNNSGKNPLYSCISAKGGDFVRLAQAFSENVVYFTKPDTVLSKAFSDTAPSVVIECGISGEARGVRRGAEFLESVWLKGGLWKEARIRPAHVYRAFAKLCLGPEAEVSFSADLEAALLKGAGLRLRDDFDELNFQRLREGAVLGAFGLEERPRGRPSEQEQPQGRPSEQEQPQGQPSEQEQPQGCPDKHARRASLIKLIDSRGRDIFDQFFSLAGRRLTVKSPLIPSMFTKNIKIAKTDCLGYAMKKIPIKDFLSGSF